MARLLRPKRFRYEYDLLQQGTTVIAGCDEAGRRPLAGPVFAAAVTSPHEWIADNLPKPLRKINDSKQFAHEAREAFFAELTSRPEVRFGIGQVDVALIDQINILQASHRA